MMAAAWRSSREARLANGVSPLSGRRARGTLSQ